MGHVGRRRRPIPAVIRQAWHGSAQVIPLHALCPLFFPGDKLPLRGYRGAGCYDIVQRRSAARERSVGKTRCKGSTCDVWARRGGTVPRGHASVTTGVRRLRMRRMRMRTACANASMRPAGRAPSRYLGPCLQNKNADMRGLSVSLAPPQRRLLAPAGTCSAWRCLID